MRDLTDSPDKRLEDHEDHPSPSTIYQVKLFPPNKSYICLSTFRDKFYAELAIADMRKRGYHTTLTEIKIGI